MTIGYVLDDSLDQSDGVQQAVIAIAERMRSLGHDVHYIVPLTKRVDLKNIHSVARTASLKFNGNSIRTPIWCSKKAVAKLFSEVDFDVLHVQMPYSPIMAARVMRLAPSSTRIVGTFHILPYGFVTNIGTRALGLVLKRSLARIGQAYAVSRPALEFMKKTFKLEGSVVANPVNFSFFHEFSSKSSSESPRTRLVFIGRFEARKGVKQLVAAFEKLSNKKGLELIMCGKGPLWESLGSRVARRRLNIVMPGFVSEADKAKYLASADIAVFPSTGGESFGIVLAEAMAAGAGITIGGDNPGYASVLEGWPETLFNPNNETEFVSKLEELINDPQKRKLIGAQQHEAVKRYDIEVIVSKLLSEGYNKNLKS